MVNVARNYFVSGVGSYSYSGAITYLNSPPSGETHFYHPAYKAIVERLGLSNAEYDAQRIVKLNITDEAQLIRFEAMQRYLMDNRIRVVLAGDSYSHPVTTKTTPDDLFTLNDFVLDYNEPRRQLHLEKMIEITDSSAFKRWLS